jgi:hypothetical protein
MRRDDAEILKMFQFELRFLEDGGYRRSPRTPCRASYVSEDSPTHLNLKYASRPHPCAECSLMKFVPPQFRKESAPCRFIPLFEAGVMVDHLYRSGTQMQLEEALACWLRKQIQWMAIQPPNANGPAAAHRTDDPGKLAELSGEMQASQR